jgi:hypothetical protein
MVAVARHLDTVFNDSLTKGDRTTGFILLVFPFGEREGRCNYISNGANREDVVKLLEEQATRLKESA